ncbi:MAG TPA: S8 family serine peptidase [Vicinamibacterales bacterium]|nr:S8 family serine peptidase [Vicinamibacterales bacterium]
MRRSPRQYSRPPSLLSAAWFFALLLSVAVAAVAELRGQRDVASIQRATETIDGHEAAAREVLVRFRREPPAGEIEALVDAMDVVHLPAGARRIRSRSARAADLVAMLSQRPDVVYAEPNYILRATNTVPNDPLFPQQWFLSNGQTPGADIHAPAAWDLTTGSGAHVVGIVDTGISHAHSDLVANLWSAPAPFTIYTNGGQTREDCPAGAHGYDAYRYACDPIDGNGHGTGMAGIVGATGNDRIGVSGVNWRARIMDLRFLGPDGSGSTSDLINVLDAAIQLKQIFGVAADVRVLSNSDSDDAYSQALADEIAKTNAAGMLFVVAAGNSSQNNDVTPAYPANDDAPNVVAVAATSQTDNLSSYSNYGATTVHVGAPGDDITTTNNVVASDGSSTYRSISGTSPATAVVSGVAGLVLSQCNLGTAQLKNLLLQTVDPVPALGGKSISGGRVNADRALQHCAAGNQAPRVSLTSPDDQSHFTMPATIVITADAADADGHVTRVDFYANGAYLGTDTTAPYSFQWSGVTAGTYTLTAVATDNLGATSSSIARQIFVNQPASLPSPWSTEDIGDTGVTGWASDSSGVFAVYGGGADIWGTADAFRFVYQPLIGDGTITAEVSSIENGEPWTKAGVMIRDTLDANSAHAFMLVSLSKGLAFQRRTVTGGESTNTSGGSGTAPRFVKLARVGQTITASTSADGRSWTVVGHDTFSMMSTVYAGLAVSSHDATKEARATFEQVSVLPNSSTSLPHGWFDRDIGAVGSTGNAQYANGTFTVKASGADIWGAADAFHYVYRPWIGDGSIVARVASVTEASAWSKAGVMFRATLDANAAHAFMLVSAAKGVAFQRRDTTGGDSIDTAGPSAAPPRWMRLARSGNMFTAYQSSDGTSWTRVGIDTISMPQTIYVGLAVTSHDNTRATTAALDAVTVSSSNVPSPWQDADVGAVGSAGSGQYANGTFTVKASGADVWGTVDAFHYVYQPWTGDGSVIARVASVTDTNAWSKAGVMFRATLHASAPHAFMLVSAAKGVAFQRRDTSGGDSINTVGPSAAPPRWVRLERQGDTFTALESGDGATWVVVGTDTIPMTQTIYVGLAVTSHDNTRLATGTFSNVSVSNMP